MLHESFNRRGATDKQRREERMKYPLKHLVKLRIQAIMAISGLLIAMAVLFAFVTFTLDERRMICYVAAPLGLAWSIGEVIFCLVRRHAGMHYPTAKIWPLFVCNILMLLIGAAVVCLIGLSLSPVNLRIGVPYFGFALAVTLLECVCTMVLFQNRQFREGANLSDHSINSTTVLNYRLITSIIAHAILIVPTIFLYRGSFNLSAYLPFMVFIYTSIVILLNLFGFYSSKQETELPPLLVYFTLSSAAGFFGGFLLLMICVDISSFEVGFHPLLWSVTVFGLGVTSWALQFGCTHRAWVLIKYKIQLRKNLGVNYQKNIQVTHHDDSTDLSPSDYFETIFSSSSTSLPLMGQYGSSEDEYEQ